LELPSSSSVVFTYCGMAGADKNKPEKGW